MKKAVIYVHGRGGSAKESEHYQPLFPGHEVLGFDYKAQTPWEALEEFPAYFGDICRRYGQTVLVANSIGAYLSMSALSRREVSRAFLISSIVDMERLILDMMGWAGVTEEQLREQGEIPTPFGETLSWSYLCYVRSHPISWDVPTEMIYGEKDTMTAFSTVSAFARRIGAGLRVIENAEHWFHTPEQMGALDDWLRSFV